MSAMRRLAAACLLLALAAPAGAQTAGAQTAGPTPEAMQAAADLAQALGVENQVGQVLGLMRNQMVQMIQRGTPGKSPAEIAQTVDDVLLPEMRARLGELKSRMVAIYAANYSVEDMKALREFYATPLGQRVLKAAPQIGAESFAVGQQWGQQVANDAIRKNAEELRRRGVTL